MRARVLASFTAALPFVMGAAEKAATRCEPLVPIQGPLGYRGREDRCEGLYQRNIESTVRIRSLVDGPVTAAPGERIQLSFPPSVPAGSYHLRVTSSDPFKNYQLDTDLVPPAAFSWPIADVLGPAGIPIDTLAPLAWTRTPDGLLYVPVLIAKRPATSVTVVVESTVPFERYRATLRAPRQSTPVTTLRAADEPPSTALVFHVPKTGRTGMRELWLSWLLVGESEPESYSWLIWFPP
jgi:hypothetical protein